MKILNLYSGIGGNRKLWGKKHEITAVEFDPEIAKIYSHFFPKDKMIVTDAHKYLEDHFEEFDFIWTSPPCPSHSRVRKATTHQNKPIFPDMKLYEEILFLKHYFNGKWVVENVIPYYTPLIPAKEIGRHLFWTNFDITNRDFIDDRKHESIRRDSVIYDFSLSEFEKIDKRKILRNMVNPEISLHILNESIGKKSEIFEQSTLF